MSTDLESDSELKALRNELLTGLQKKRNSFDAQEPSLNPIEENGPQVAEEDELEMLRMQALNAKRSRDNCTANLDNNSSTGSYNLKVRSNVVPGRFRYNKDSDEEDEDEDDEEEGFSYDRIVEIQDKLETPASLNDTKNGDNSCKTDQEYNNNEQYFNNNDNSNNNQYKDLNNYDDLTRGFNDNNSQHRNYQYNSYQTYRTECSKLMSNDEYDPNNLYELTPRNQQNNTTMPQDFDLRNFLRQKAQQQQGPDTFNANTGFYTDYTNSEDIVYSEPITRPIEITNNFMYNRGSRHRGYSRFISHTSFYADNNGENSKRQRYANDEDETNEDNVNSSSDSESDEEESFLNSKKLKSVIVKAVMSTDTTRSEVLDTSDRTRSRSRNHSRNRHHKRK